MRHVWFGLFLATVASAWGAEQPLAGYLSYDDFAARVAKIGGREGARVSSLGKSEAGRDVWLITLSRGKPEEKPAWVIVGSVEPNHPAGGETALRLAEQISERAAHDAAYGKLLDQLTLYFIPRPDPDGVEKCFLSPRREPGGNGRKTDDDRDFDFGEDPPDDLNGDGWITQMRIEDETGKFRIHPEDPRVMIAVDPKKNERGTHRVLTEGRDNDGDEQWNEDAGDGVNFNRNFTFRYAGLQKGSGANAVSEPESRAVAEFLYDHPHIAGVLTFTPEDNLFYPWKPDAGKDKDRVRTTILSADATTLESITEDYRTRHGGKDAPTSSAGKGSFSDWAYFHFGRWSLAARGWWVPKVDEEKKPDDKKPDDKKPDDKKPDDAKAEDKDKEAKKPAEDKRGADDRNALRWLAKQDIDGFVPWQEVKHPDFPDRKVEVGGFRPFVLLNPPLKELDALAEKHGRFLIELSERLPKLKILEARAESLGGGTYRLKTQVANLGYLPTFPEMGAVSQQPSPVQMEWSTPPDVVWLLGHRRSRVGRLEGNGGSEKTSWLIRFSGDVPATLKLRVFAPAVGVVETEVALPR